MVLFLVVTMMGVVVVVVEGYDGGRKVVVVLMELMMVVVVDMVRMVNGDGGYGKWLLMEVVGDLWVEMVILRW